MNHLTNASTNTVPQSFCGNCQAYTNDVIEYSPNTTGYSYSVIKCGTCWQIKRYW